jgi:hypothetical protein
MLHDKQAVRYSLLNESTPYYKYNPSKVLENNVECLYWDRGILTDNTIPHNHPDIILFEKTNIILYLTDVSISNFGNLQTAYTKKKEEKICTVQHRNETTVTGKSGVHLACRCTCSRGNFSHIT